MVGSHAVQCAVFVAQAEMQGVAHALAVHDVVAWAR